MLRATAILLFPAFFGLSALGLRANPAAELSPEDLQFFEARIRPVLSQECYKCHSEEAKKIKGGLLLDRKAGWVQGGDSGEVIVPGDPEASILIKMVEHDPDYDQMPPKSKLSPQQIEDLREWVRRGAPDPRNEALGEDLLESEFNLEERKAWWSLQAVNDPGPPELRDGDWPLNSYDAFILAKLEEEDWSPAPPAAKEHLLRRASLALTGLAPTEDELRAFLADDSPEAYEKVVDHLLASPHFGERWARHWMDSARFSDTKAFEADYTMPHLFRYRDFLVRAFNEDVPFDRFVREQLAGDLLPDPRVSPESGLNESLAGPGFLYITDGQHGPPDIHADEARVFDSIIQATGVTFQGLTISCAKCHDHKFDAITAGDYYSLYGMLRSSRLHYANMADPVVLKEETATLADAKADLVDSVLSHLQQQSTKLPKLLDALWEIRQSPDYQDWAKALRAPLKKGESAPTRLKAFQKASRTAVEDAASSHGVAPPLLQRWLHWAAQAKAPPELLGLRQILNGAPPTKVEQLDQSRPADTGQGFGLQGDALGEWVASGRGFRPALADTLIPDPNDDRIFRTAVAAGATTGTLSSRLDGALRSPDFILDGTPVELWAKGKDAVVRLVVRNYELTGYGPTTKGLRVAVNSDQWKRIRFNTDLWKGEPAYLEIQHHGGTMNCVPASGNFPAADEDAYAAIAIGALPSWHEVWMDATKEDAVPSVDDLPALIGNLIAEVRVGIAKPADLEVLGALFAAQLLPLNRQNDPGLAEALARFRAAQARLPAPVYARSIVDGDPEDTPVYLRGDHRRLSEDPNPRRFLDGFGGAPYEGGSSGRLHWADHVASTANPLTARVRVNRIWARLFGQGLVSSVDDFGKMGALPSHPGLLDHLAQDFMEHGWSTKHIIRKMILSRTFRMSSTPSAASTTEDPKNILLQHMAVQRMDAESIRDHILACSGRLDRTTHGPSIPSYVEDHPRSRAFPKRKAPLDGAGRRSVYLEIRRNFMPSFLRAFDLPNASETTGQRHTTNVPAQALALLNDPFVHQQSLVWAQSLLERSPDPEERLRIIHRQAFSREATEEDLTWGRQALEAFADAGSEEDIWTALCHVIINRKEFLYVR